jgi:cell division protein FtsA
MFKSKSRSQNETRQIVAGLDIGTSKIAVVIGERSGHAGERSDQPETRDFTGEPCNRNSVLITGAGSTPSKGFRQGVVIHFDEAIQSIRTAVQEAQLTAGVEIDEVYVGIAGDHIHSVNSRGVVAVSRMGQGVTEEDRDRVLQAAKAIALPGDRKVIHILPQEYIVDNQAGIKNPVGLSGVRLEAEVHIVTCTSALAQNLLRAVDEAGLTTRALVLEPLASSLAVLEADEKKLGVILMDIGGGTTDVAMFFGEAIRHTAVVPWGGQSVTNDIAIGLKTSLEDAEEIKRKHGCCHERRLAGRTAFSTVAYGGRGPKEVSRELLMSIIQPRMEEIFLLVQKEIKRSEYETKMDAGLVLTGGGALMTGAAELAEEIFQLPVRLGIPKGFSGLTESVSSPVYATGIGLVLFGLDAEKAGLTEKDGGLLPIKGGLGRIWKKFRDEFLSS